MSSIKRQIAVSIAAAASMAVLAGPAQGARVDPQYQSTFSGSGDHQIADAASVAMDDTTKDLYVVDRANNRVEKFDSTGNFLFMFGNEVNATTGGNICPEASNDLCQNGQATASSYPHFESATSIAVDNSSGPSAGSVYVGASTVSKFDSSGHLATGWGEEGQLGMATMEGFGQGAIAVSATTGELYVFGGGPTRFFAFSESGARGDNPFLFGGASFYVGGGFASMAIDSHDDLYYQSGGTPTKVDWETMQTKTGSPLGPLDSGAAEGFAVDTGTDEVYVDRGSEVTIFPSSCEPRFLGPCTPKESFGTGDFIGGEGLAVDPDTGYVYVATDAGIAVFKPLIIPDVSEGPPANPGHTEAAVFGHADPAGGGGVTTCTIEYGPTTAYGATAPCDQSVPFESAQDVSGTITGLTPEAVYHYRFVVGNAQGTGTGPDQEVAPHWVLSLSTGAATDVGPGTATLLGVLNPNGEQTHYYFEWGTSTDYGNSKPIEPGADTAGPEEEAVSVTLDGLLTSETTYHYRLVAANGLGRSTGGDRSFTTPIAAFPEVRGPAAAAVGMTAAELRAEVSPGFGDTAVLFQYGTSSNYGLKTELSSVIGHDGVFRAVGSPVADLLPGTTYHFRVVAMNFKGTTHGEDQSFTTPDLPRINATSAVVLDGHPVHLAAQVSAGGSSGATLVHFEFGPTTTYGAQSGAVGPLASSGEAGTDLSGLSPGTTYHFRAVASNGYGVTTGPDSTFVVPPIGSPDHPQQAHGHCKKGMVRRKGKCVKKSSARHHRRANGAK